MTKRMVFLVAACMLVAGCLASQSRMGMVVDKDSGLQYGSVVENSLMVDAGQFRNKKLKLRLRNTSGDPAFDLYAYQAQLEEAFADHGYTPTKGDDYGLLLNVNVVYSGQITDNMLKEFAFLGGVGGGVAGYKSKNELGTLTGTVAGATVGAIIGSYVRDETYIIIADVSFALAGMKKDMDEDAVYFGSSRKREPMEMEGVNTFRRALGTRVASYAGGRNAKQADIAPSVCDRLFRILRDVI
ncbi:MAG: complement resistance protein TraT [Desulfovibrionaceae bacterium]